MYKYAQTPLRDMCPLVGQNEDMSGTEQLSQPTWPAGKRIWPQNPYKHRPKLNLVCCRTRFSLNVSLACAASSPIFQSGDWFVPGDVSCSEFETRPRSHLTSVFSVANAPQAKTTAVLHMRQHFISRNSWVKNKFLKVARDETNSNTGHISLAWQ